MEEAITYARLHAHMEARAEIATLSLGLDKESTQNGWSGGYVIVQDQDGDFVDINYIEARGEDSSIDTPIMIKRRQRI